MKYVCWPSRILKIWPDPTYWLTAKAKQFRYVEERRVWHVNVSLEACRQSWEDYSEDRSGIQWWLQYTWSSMEVCRWDEESYGDYFGQIPPVGVSPSLKRSQNRGKQEQKQNVIHSPWSTGLPCQAQFSGTDDRVDWGRSEWLSRTHTRVMLMKCCWEIGWLASTASAVLRRVREWSTMNNSIFRQRFGMSLEDQVARVLSQKQIYFFMLSNLKHHKDSQSDFLAILCIPCFAVSSRKWFDIVYPCLTWNTRVGISNSCCNVQVQEYNQSVGFW